MKPISAFTKGIIPAGLNKPDTRRAIELRELWQHVAGTMAPHARPMLQRSGRLVIICESPVWATNIRFQAPSILKQFREYGFSVREVAVKVSPANRSRPQPASQAEHVIPISEEAAKSIIEASKKATNPRLKLSLERLARTAQRQLRNQ